MAKGHVNWDTGVVACPTIFCEAEGKLITRNTPMSLCRQGGSQREPLRNLTAQNTNRQRVWHLLHQVAHTPIMGFFASVTLDRPKTSRYRL